MDGVARTLRKGKCASRSHKLGQLCTRFGNSRWCTSDAWSGERALRSLRAATETHVQINTKLSSKNIKSQQHSHLHSDFQIILATATWPSRFRTAQILMSPSSSARNTQNQRAVRTPPTAPPLCRLTLRMLFPVCSSSRRQQRDTLSCHTHKNRRAPFQSTSQTHSPSLIRVDETSTRRAIQRRHHLHRVRSSSSVLCVFRRLRGGDVVV